jgi:rsbT co-antagonist protein RsbR
MKQENSAIDDILTAGQDQVLNEWLAELVSSGGRSGPGANAAADDATPLLLALRDGIRADAHMTRFDEPGWEPLRGVLAALSASRAAQGLSAGETSQFVMALKKPLFTALQQRFAGQPERLLDMVWLISTLVDKMAQWTASAYQRSREDVIARQQQDLLELSTPVVKLWDGVLAVPMIGTLDSSRTQLVMESLLQRIVDTGSELAIIDITGVPTVDTLVAQHLLKTVTAIRLMGADCIISGVRPQIAQTIVHLGIDLQGIVTKASLADALALALKRLGYNVTRSLN